MSGMGPNPRVPSGDGGADIRRGLPMFSAADPEALAREKAELAALAGKPRLVRWIGYGRKTGPAWLQSALTLGGGSAWASLTIGAFFRYELLWVQPVAMILGIIVLAAISHQALSTGARPFGAMKRYVGPRVAWAWALASLAATVIWHFPQYALAAGMTESMIEAATGWAPTGRAETALLVAIGVVVLIVSTAITWNYPSGRRGIRLYERALKAMVWLIIVAFAVVIVRSTIAGRIEWGKVLKGFLPLHIPTDPKGIETLMAALGAAIGINMTFLFPYTLLARGWGREHRGLSRFGLVTGMLVPFTIATSLMVVAAGCTIYDRLEFLQVKEIAAETWQPLCAALRGADSPARRRAWQRLPDSAKAAAESGAKAEPLDERHKTSIIDGLNVLIASRGLYRQEDVTGVAIPQDIAELLKRDPDSLPDKEVRRANRAVLAAAYAQRIGQAGSEAHLIPPLGRKVSPTRGAEMIAAGVGSLFGRIIFGFGILGMVLSTITLHMLVCGFVVCEVFGIEPSGWKYRLACLVPVPGFLGVVLWQYMQGWIAIRASAIAGLLTPIAYIAFFILNNRRKYLGEDTPTGAKAWLWNAAIVISIVATCASIAYFLIHNYDKVLGLT
jgi:Mn2+/Fe2+ NRAMP family transporter